MQDKKWIWLAIRAGISLLLLTLLFGRIDVSRFSEILRNTNPSLFLVCLLSYLLLYIPLSYRWQLLLQVIGIEVPIKSLFMTYLIGVFFNNFFPTTIGGDLVRGYDLWRYTQKGEEIAISILLERFLGITALLVIAAIALNLSDSSLRDPLFVWLILGVAVVYLTALLILATPRIFLLSSRVLQKFKIQQLGQRWLRVSKAISLYRSSPRVLVQAVLLSLILQSLTILVYYVLSLSLHLRIPLIYFFLFFPIICIVAMLPISLGGLGLREGITLYLFQKIGVESAHAMSLSLAWFSFALLTSLLGGAILTFRNIKRSTPSAPRI